MGHHTAGFVTGSAREFASLQDFSDAGGEVAPDVMQSSARCVDAVGDLKRRMLRVGPQLLQKPACLVRLAPGQRSLGTREPSLDRAGRAVVPTRHLFQSSDRRPSRLCHGWAYRRHCEVGNGRVVALAGFHRSRRIRTVGRPLQPVDGLRGRRVAMGVLVAEDVLHPLGHCQARRGE